MTKRSEINCYESRYGAEWISPAKRLAEMACERLAGDTTLGTKFWKNSPWDKIFVRELVLANRLLKHPFSPEAIMKAFSSFQGRRVKTLGAAFFIPLIQIEQRRLDLEAAKMESAPLPENINTLETPRPIKRPGKSIREKLTNDGEREDKLS